MASRFKGIGIGLLLGTTGALLVHWLRPQVPATALSIGLLVNLWLLALVCFTVYIFVTTTTVGLLHRSGYTDYCMDSAVCMVAAFCGGTTAGLKGAILGFGLGALIGLLVSPRFPRRSGYDFELTVTQGLTLAGIVIGTLIGVLAGHLPLLSVLLATGLGTPLAIMGGLLLTRLLLGEGGTTMTGGAGSPSLTIGLVAAIVMVAAFFLFP